MLTAFFADSRNSAETGNSPSKSPAGSREWPSQRDRANRKWPKRIGTLAEHERQLKRCTRAAEAAGGSLRCRQDPNDAVVAQIAGSAGCQRPRSLRQSLVKSASLTTETPATQHPDRPTRQTDPPGPWLVELGPIAEASGSPVQPTAVADIDAWRSRYPNHPTATSSGARY